MKFLSLGQHRSAADVAQEHVRFLHLVERRSERFGNCFLDQTFTQSDAQITAQNLDHVLPFPGGKMGQTILQSVFLRHRPAEFVQQFKKLVGINQVKRFRNCPAIENFERGLARITMAGSDATKIGVAYPRRTGECAVDDRAADLQRAQIGLRKSMSGKIGSGDRDLCIVQGREVF